jgi:D-3-phosphoglycerate dehydrogenase
MVDPPGSGGPEPPVGALTGGPAGQPDPHPTPVPGAAPSARSSRLGPAPRGSRVVITDHPWPGTDVEAGICAAGGFVLVDASPGQDPLAVRDAARDAVGILTNWAPVRSDLMASSPQLRVVTRLGVGVDNIDVAAAADLGVVVTRVPDYCVEEVSDHAVAMVLEWARGITFFDRQVRAGRFDPGARALRRVRDRVIGIWGAGRNGMAAARKFAGLGCTVLVDDRHPERVAPFEPVRVAELLERSDVVSIHLPLTQETVDIVDARVLSAMRPGSLLVNTGRGRLVDVDALVAALDTGRPGAAALDVLPDEPHIPQALSGRDDVLITPHVAFSSIESVAEVRRRATEDLVRVLLGEAPLDPYP